MAKPTIRSNDEKPTNDIDLKETIISAHGDISEGRKALARAIANMNRVSSEVPPKRFVRPPTNGAYRP